MELCWYAVHVRSQFEQRVVQRLSDAGIEAWWPSFLENRRWSDRQKQIERALFPGYLFTRLDADKKEHVHQVLITSGVVRILGDLRPIAIPDVEVAGIRTLLESGAELRIDPLHHQFKAGEKVVVMRGSFRGIEGTFQGNRRRDRVVVAVPLLNRVVSAVLDGDSIRSLEVAA